MAVLMPYLLVAQSNSNDAQMQKTEEERMKQHLEELNEFLKIDMKKVAEDMKKVAEDKRKVVEDMRKVAEENRKIAEENRKLAEESRKIAEENMKLAIEEQGVQIVDFDGNPITFYPQSPNPQSSSRLFEKYGKNKHFHSVTMSGELFKLLAGASIEFKNKQGDEISKMLKDVDFSTIKNFKLLSINQANEENKGVYNSFMTEVENAAKRDKRRYTELLQANNVNDENISIYVKKENTDIHEIIAYRINNKQQGVSVVFIEGVFSEEVVKKLLAEVAKQMN